MSNTGLSMEYSFSKAVPVWENGTEKMKNRSLIFCSNIKGNSEIKIKIACHSRYQIFVNGQFYAAGPARAAHGFYRVSEYNLCHNLFNGDNIISVIAAGYNVNSYYLLDEPSFLCMEIERNGEIIFATGDESIKAFVYSDRLTKTPRYSFQRPFTECYKFHRDYDFYNKPSFSELDSIELFRLDNKKFITRNVPYCEYDIIKADKIIAKGKMEQSAKPKIFCDRSINEIGEKLKGYTEEELEVSPVNELYKYYPKILDFSHCKAEDALIEADSFCLYDMSKNNTGYIHINLKADEDTVLYAVFNEILPDGSCTDPGKDNCENVVKWQLQGGRAYSLVSFEPYTFRYIQIIAMNAPVLITDVSIYEECYPRSLLSGIKKIDNEELGLIYDAAVETFRQNATDIFMDCPSRERAGWLCDSYFTAFAERTLTGNSTIERNFIENYLLPDSFDFIPKGMLPMCYPADHYDGVYIHNWAFWFVLELRNYVNATNDIIIKDAAKQKVLELLEFSKKYENQDGLLQNLDSWIFVEWSKANDFVRDINYPSNMLYANVLEAAAQLYDMKELFEKAQRLKKTIIEKSFDGEFFTDNGILNDKGEVLKTNNRTETCQYYAFFTKTATKESFPKLYDTLINDFGAKRKTENKYPNIHMSNAFIGNYLRLFILLENGETEKLISEIKDFFLPMAEKTGTLWENMTDYASCCHGFCSALTYILS